MNYTDEDFRNIAATMLVLIGDRDQFIPVEDAVAMYRLIPNADHSLPRTKIELFADTVMEFLNRLSAQSGSA
jgi:pimeloyl-ACP methyl ester carboxylesterase